MIKRAAGLAEDLAQHVDNVILFDEVDSTHAVALRLIDQLDGEGLSLRPTVVVAAAQSRGVGRGRRRWASPAGGLYLSWLSSGITEERIAQLPMLAAASALKAVNESGVANARIKWPNDILVDRCKLAGILVHARRSAVSCVIVSLGVNISPVNEPIDEPLQPPTSLAEVIGADEAADRSGALSVRFVSALTESLEDPRPAIERWTTHLIHRPGDEISVRLSSGTVCRGSFDGVTPEGYLRLLSDGGNETILSGGDVIE